MSQDRIAQVGAEEEGRSLLDELVFQGAREMLRVALEAEVEEFLEQHRDARDGEGRRQVIRNGHLPERKVVTGAGAVPVRRPRIRDLRGVEDPESVRFESKILPRYLRRSKSIDELIPWLYLRGISTSEMRQALEALVGQNARNLSASVVTRLTAKWTAEYEEWRRRDLSSKEYVYVWADGVHFNIRLGEDRQCILVLIGATREGQKEILAIEDGYRESKQSWREILLDLKRRGLRRAPKLAVGDGALGFWSALEEVFPSTRAQRCWVHKTANVLNKLPKRLQARGKAALHEIWMAESRDVAGVAFDGFIEKYEAKYPKAVACLAKDREALLAFYDFPAEHWRHLRTTNPIESTFSTVRHRHGRTKGSGTRAACLAMVFQLMRCAEKKWRKLNAAALTVRVAQGDTFVDGILKDAA